MQNQFLKNVSKRVCATQYLFAFNISNFSKFRDKSIFRGGPEGGLGGVMNPPLVIKKFS